jgi:predicted PurR-regulated permease PerM
MTETPDPTPALPEPPPSAIPVAAPVVPGPAAAGQPEPVPLLPSPTAHWGPVHLLAVLVLVAGCWAGKELLVPILLALFLSLVANPLVSKLQKLHIPRWIAAFFVVFGGFALAVTLATQLVGPAGTWLQKAPQELRQVAPKLKGLVRQVNEANKAAASVVSAAGAAPAGSSKAQAAALAQDQPAPPNLWTLIRATPAVLAIIGAVILLSYFFVVYGINLQQRVIGLLPFRQQKRLTAEILQTIEYELSRYVLTISIINTVLGACVAAVLLALGLDLGDALLWGALGGLLNFAPYVGPVLGVTMLALVGVVAFDEPSRMLLPPLCYLGLQFLETQVITPIILGQRWSISPLIVLLWLLFCGWLWSIPGVLLAVPMLVCFKIVTERVEGLQGWSKVIE